MPTLYYYHDPMCSWCWGYRPIAQRLFRALPDGLVKYNVLGGLAADTDQPMPEAMQQDIMRHWRTIHAKLGTPFNFDFWRRCTPRRATYPACRAVIAAAAQGREEQMIDAIQQAYYLRAMNPSEQKTLRRLANELGLNADRFRTDLEAEHTETTLQEQIAKARRAPIHGFPGLALETADGLQGIEIDYRDHRHSLADINAKLAQMDTGGARA